MIGATTYIYAIRGVVLIYRMSDFASVSFHYRHAYRHNLTCTKRYLLA